MCNTTFIGLVWFQVLDFLACNTCGVLQFSPWAYCLFLSRWGTCWSLPRISTDTSSLSLLCCNPSYAIAHFCSFSPLFSLLPRLSHKHLFYPRCMFPIQHRSSYRYFRSCKRVLPCTVCSIEYYLILEDRLFFSPLLEMQGDVKNIACLLLV